MSRPARTLLPFSLFLELCHTAQFAIGRGALQEPLQLGVLGDLALDEEGADVGVQADGDEESGDLQGPPAQLGRVVVQRQGVKVHDHVVGVVVVLLGGPVTEGAQVATYVHVTGGLDTRQDPGHRRRCYWGMRGGSPRYR